MGRELLIFADESAKRGPIYSNFYGGAAVESLHLREVNERLLAVCHSAGLGAEVKWTKVTDQYLDRYVQFVDEVFDLLEEDKMKLRVMFTQNIHDAVGLQRYHYQNQFQILYYFFLKHAFGLQHANNGPDPLAVRFYLDKLPVAPHEAAVFKGFIHALERDRMIRRARIQIPTDQIAEIDSHDHLPLQAIDVVLGSMQFRLNKRHLAIPPGATRRGRKTRAKERLYKHINARIRTLYPGVQRRRDDRPSKWLSRPVEPSVPTLEVHAFPAPIEKRMTPSLATKSLRWNLRLHEEQGLPPMIRIALNNTRGTSHSR